MSYLELKKYTLTHFFYTKALNIRQDCLLPAQKTHTNMSAQKISEAIGKSHHNLGLFYIDVGEIRKAAISLQAALYTAWQHHPEAIDTQYFLAWAYFQQKRYKKSGKIYNEILIKHTQHHSLNDTEIKTVKKHLKEISKKLSYANDDKVEQKGHRIISGHKTNSTPKPLAAKNNPKPFPCLQCKKSFKNAGDLTRHLRSHSGEQPFQCPLCPKKFSRKGNMQVHIRIHNNEKSFVCTICHKKFPQKQHLQAHSYSHTGEKPFKCPICKKGFSQKHHMKAHMPIHTGEKPFKCPICLKRFSQKHHMKNHLRVHRNK